MNARSIPGRLIFVVTVLCWLTGCAGIGPPREHAMPIQLSTKTGPLRIAIVGMTHQHVEGLLYQAQQRKHEIQIVGVFEPNRALFARFAVKYGLAESLRFDDLARMLDETKPEAVSVMNAISEHRATVEACAPRGVHLLLEKPLAFRNEDARRMAELAARHGVLVLTNYETSWYSSVRTAKELVSRPDRAAVGARLDAGTWRGDDVKAGGVQSVEPMTRPTAGSEDWGALRKMVFRHGHRGPIEIGCMPEFTDWLTDPEKNGGGAIVDFGCYGAVLATWMMDGARPTRVVASAATLKPEMYPRVDDDATIVLTYPTATAVIQASWCWTHDNKEMDLYTETGSLHAGKWNRLERRVRDGAAEVIAPAGNSAGGNTADAGHAEQDLENEWTYLRKVVRGECAVDPLSSLELNLIAVEILDEARRQVAR